MPRWLVRHGSLLLEIPGGCNGRATRGLGDQERATGSEETEQRISHDCRICKTPGAQPLAGFRFGEFRLVRCRGCGVAFVSPLPLPAELTAYYGGAYRPPRRSPEQDRVAARFVVRLLREAGVPEGNVLDFGAGWGALAKELQALDYTVSGLELADRDRALATANGIPTVRDLSELGDHAFNAVLARHVIEHLPTPLETLKAIRRVLEPGGVVLIGVPNFASVAARLLRGGWEWFAPPAHLWYFDRASLSGLLARAGFAPIRTVTIQGDGAPLPLALSAAPGRWALRRRATPGYWRASAAPGGPGQETEPRARVVRAYTTVMRFVKYLWSWGDEELWVVARA